MGKLAATTCETAKPTPGKDRILRDGDGLMLRIRPNGTKTWVVEYLHVGERTKYTIGHYDCAGAPGQNLNEWLDFARLSLTQARSIAGNWKQARKAGHNPAKERQAILDAKIAEQATQQAAKDAEESQPTYTKAMETFLAKHIAGKASASATRYRLERLSAIVGDRKLIEINKAALMAGIEEIAEGKKDGKDAKQLAGEVLTQAKRLWHFAMVRGWATRDNASDIASLKRSDFDARPRQRKLNLKMDELVKLWQALDDRSRCKADPLTVAAIKLLILTGQRATEVTGAEWAEFDLDAKLWTIPAHRMKIKDRGAHQVHLAPQVMAILQQLAPMTGKAKHVFDSPLKPGQPINSKAPNAVLQRFFAKGHLPGVTPCHAHDLRRTLITRLPDLGVDAFIGHKIAHHVLSGVFAIYNQQEYMPQREAALITWAERIETLASTNNVIQLHRAA